MGIRRLKEDGRVQENLEGVLQVLNKPKGEQFSGYGYFSEVLCRDTQPIKHSAAQKRTASYQY
jgi:hypothetical protein